MYSNRSEHSHRRQHSDRSSRQWNDYDDRRQDRREPHRDVPRDSFQKYGGDGHSRAEGGNRSREYSNSPQRRYSKDTMSRDWSRKSPVRRRGSSPDRGATEKRRRFDDHDDDHKYRYEPEDKTYRQSPDGFSRQPKDFKHSLPQKDDFQYKKTSQDSRHRHEDFTYRKQHDDHRPVSGYHKDRDHRERDWERSDGTTQSQESPRNNFVKARAREDSPSRSHEDHHQSSTRFPLNEPCGQSFEHDLINHTLPAQKSNEGFQRFLNVLNKGVNVAMLTKIVTRPSPEANNRPHSPASFTDTVQRLWSADSDEKQQGSHQNNCQWSESEGPRRAASPQPHHKTFSPVGRSLSDDPSLRRSDGGQSHHGLNSKFGSPSVVGNKTMTPEDEHKHKQMQDVLQAIGLDLGSEELGQMSHRIQERLYGKRDGDPGRCQGQSREKDTKRALSPQYRSRSSSSNQSNFSSLTGDSHMKKDSCSGQTDGTEVHPIQVLKTVEYVQNNSSNSIQDSDQCETNSQETTATFQTFSHDNSYSVSEPPPPTVPLTYSPVNYTPLPYSPLPPPLPPNLPHVRPSVFLPPYLPFPPVPPVNFFPAVHPPPNHLLPQHIINPQSNFQNLPQINQYQPLNNAQKSKTQSRRRCLQVIQTKQPG